MNCVLVRRGEETETQEERTSCDDRSRHWSMIAASQGILKISGKPPETSKRQGRIHPSRPFYHLNFGSLLSRTVIEYIPVG